MVSRLVRATRPKQAGLGRSLSIGVPGLFAAAVWLAFASAFAGCSKSECLQVDCATSAPVTSDSSAGASSVTPSNRKCTANSGCRTSMGEFCVSGTCELACRTHYDCQGYGECESGTDSDGNTGHYCVLGNAQQPGQFYARCPAGLDSDCDSKNGFFCVSAGADDLESYCTADCKTDSDCPEGLGCTPLTRTPCDAICGLAGDSKDRQCVPSDQVGVGKPYQCAGRGVARNACRPHKFCSSCESDEDCLAVANQICAKDTSGAKICTQPCDLTHPSCPWGNAATCGVWDTDLGIATCAHKFGQCVGNGKGCDPCLKDADCGARGACTASSFTGERWCVDFSVTCSCGANIDANGLCTGGGCPQSPSGLEMLCVDSTPSKPNTGVCAGANTNSSLLSSQQTGCWPAN